MSYSSINKPQKLQFFVHENRFQKAVKAFVTQFLLRKGELLKLSLSSGVLYRRRVNEEALEGAWEFHVTLKEYRLPRRQIVHPFARKHCNASLNSAPISSLSVSSSREVFAIFGTEVFSFLARRWGLNRAFNEPITQRGPNSSPLPGTPCCIDDYSAPSL